MKICFFPHYSFSNRDGATLSMYNIIDELLNRGVEVVVVLPNKNHLEERLKDKRIKFYYVPMYSMRMEIDSLTIASRVKFGIKYIHNQLCINKIVGMLKNENIDCIHINGFDSSVGAKVAKKLSIPYIWHIRQFLGEDLGKRLYRQTETYRLAEEADVVIGISRDVKDKFEKELHRPVIVVYNGIPQGRYEISDHEIFSSDDIHMLLAGRISVQKGQMVAIKAVERLLNDSVTNVYLTLIGQGETKEYLQKVHNYIRIHGLEEHITVLNHSDDLLDLRARHDIGLTCSQKEAFGRVTVENMMAGMLVIGANSGGTPEIITDGVNGLLYESDNYENLAKVIKQVCGNLSKFRDIAKCGYDAAMKEFSIQRVVDEIIEIYRKIGV